MNLINHKIVLKDLRSFMMSEGLDFFIINDTDEYLNEYIDLCENSRYLLTGFTGSTGDALVTQDSVFLFVDGRYHLQADNETDKNVVTVEKPGLDTSPKKALYDKILELSSDGQRVAFVNSKISFSGFKKMKEILSEKVLKFKEFEYDPVLKITGGCKKAETTSLRFVDITYAGLSPDEKLFALQKKMTELEIDLFVITKPEEIAYLTNLRGNEIPFNSSFKARALVDKTKCIIFTNLGKLTEDVRRKFSTAFEFKSEQEFMDVIKPINTRNIGFNPDSTNFLTYRQLELTGNNLVEIEASPISLMKSVKNEAELSHMQDCFRRTDIAVNRAICWLNQGLQRGDKISENDFSDKVKSLFFEEGATGLSFEVIAASGKNTAIVHYSHPNPEKIIESGELILLDCGAYFEGGYATDITRTFLAGGSKANASEKAKYIYTMVLKAFLNGLNYEISGNTTGYDIDFKVREITGQNVEEGFHFGHGTGHGVGILVHEAPPRVGSSEASKIPLKTGMVFTIEPGLYNNDWGGVRLENTVTLAEENGKRRIKTLTISKFDENLINYDILNEQEREWLRNYQKRALG